MNAQESSANSDVAIIICTYNPEERILARVLKAVAQLEPGEGPVPECIIVDNNSKTPVRELESVKHFLKSHAHAKVIQEYKQGVAFAKVAGFRATTASLIVFIDDDNEPAKDYLTAASRCVAAHPWVGVWGPGNISVEFLDPVTDWFAKNFRMLFHERRSSDTVYGRVTRKWMDFYPAGAGQILRRAVLEKYATAMEAGTISASGRNGRGLASAEDIQIVWEGVKMGYAAGVCPELKLTHLISARRANIKYARRLIFGTASSYLPALVESFPSEKAQQTKAIPSNANILLSIAASVLRDVLTIRFKFLLFDLARQLGLVVGKLRATQTEDRRWVWELVKILRLE